MITPKSPLRVAYFNPFPDLGGAEHSLLTLLGTLPSTVEPWVVTSRAGDLSARLDQVGIPYDIIPTPGLRHFGALRNALRVHTDHCRQRGIHLIHGNSPRGAFFGGLVSRRLDIPSIWHLRVHLGSGIRPRLLRRLNDRWLAVSRSLLREAGVSRKNKRAVVVPNGIPLDFWRRSARTLRRSAPGSTPRIGLIGRLEPLKGIREFVELAALFRKKGMAAEFVVAGSVLGPAPGRALRSVQRYVGDIMERVEKEGLGDRVHFVGPIHQVAEFLDTIDILVVPSHMEGFGRVVIEGMARGIPVVASNVGGIPEIIETGRNGWLVPRCDPKALFLACRFLLRNPHLAHRLGEAGRKKVRDKYLASHTTAGVLQVYQDLCPGDWWPSTYSNPEVHELKPCTLLST